MQKVIESRQALIQTMEAIAPENFLCKTTKLWEILARELIYIIGENGFHSLFIRSIHLTNAKYTWLNASEPFFGNELCVLNLTSAFPDRDIAEIREVNIFLFMTFIEILESLIGEVLTARIFRSAWEDHVFPKEQMMTRH